MMRFSAFIFVGLIAISSCTENSEKKSDPISIESNSVPIQETKPEVLDEPVSKIESTKDYQEYYESGSLKIEGDFDAEQKRNGIWTSYYENGIKWSESYYTNGLKNGHSITFYPNGKVRYIGEYRQDKKFGLWKFHKEDGSLDKEETY